MKIGGTIKRVDHYLCLNIDNSEIIQMIKDRTNPKDRATVNKIIYDPNILPEFCIPTREYKYHDKWGNYWDNWID